MRRLGDISNANAAEQHGIVVPEAHSGYPLEGDFERMNRRRFQDPKPKIRGNWWTLLVWEPEFAGGRYKRRRKRLRLAPATMSKREVLKIAAEKLRPLNQGLESIGSATPFSVFVDTYRSTVLPLMASSTQERYEGVIKNHLEPTFGSLLLRDLTTLSVQQYFSAMAGNGLAYESKDKIRDVLASILNAAVSYGYLLKNPADNVRVPPDRKGRRQKPYVTPQQFKLLVELIPEPYATMVFVAVYTGLRVSELVGLRWNDIHEDSITIDERYCRGDWGAPKSDASCATIGVNRCVIDRIRRMTDLVVDVRAGRAVRKYKVVKSDGPNDLVFQSVKNGRPMRDNNILARFIKPAARKLRLEFVNWRCLRTSHATWLKMAGADVKDAQAQMRHSRATTTLDIYQQFVPESQKRVVARLSSLVN